MGELMVKRLGPREPDLVADGGKLPSGREMPLQGVPKEAFQDLQPNQKDHRREVQAAHRGKCAPDRLQERFGKARDKLDDGIVVGQLDPRKDYRNENDQRIEIDDIDQNHDVLSDSGQKRRRLVIA